MYILSSFGEGLSGRVCSSLLSNSFAFYEFVLVRFSTPDLFVRLVLFAALSAYRSVFVSGSAFSTDPVSDDDEAENADRECDHGALLSGK